MMPKGEGGKLNEKNKRINRLLSLTIHETILSRVLNFKATQKLSLLLSITKGVKSSASE